MIISILCCITPLVWHAKRRNIAATCLILWVLICDIFMFINSIPWGGEDIDSYWDGNIYCDIASRVTYSGGIGMVASVAAISRNLAKIMDRNSSMPVSRTDRVKQNFIDFAICLGPSLFALSFQYIVQISRYQILRFTGCNSVTDVSPPGIIIALMWPLLMSIIASIYCALTIYRYIKRRREFKQVLTSGQSSMTVSRFARLLFFCLIVILVSLPLSCYVFILNVKTGYQSYSWSRVHAPGNWNTISIVYLDEPLPNTWFYVLVSVLLFVAFGLGTDALMMYRGWLIKLGCGRLVSKFNCFSPGSVLPSNISSEDRVPVSRAIRFDSWDSTEYDDSSERENQKDIEKYGMKDASRFDEAETESTLTQSTMELEDFHNSNLANHSVRVKYEVRVE
ncbi:pheromone A receptor-domain-containing protein [Dipodascopsis uninucleata]